MDAAFVSSIDTSIPSKYGKSFLDLISFSIFVAIPFLLLIFMQLIDAVKNYRRYKRIQINKLKMERRQLELERQNIEKMMEELKILKANNVDNSSNDDKN